MTASKSGLMEKRHLGLWLDNVFAKQLEFKNDAVLMVDSWTAFKDIDYIQAHCPVGLDLRIRNIPPGVTSMVQPLDVHFFKMWKTFQRA